MFACAHCLPSPPIRLCYRDVISSRLSLLPKVSFFDYPFIFDPASKSRILHIDAVVQMSQSM